MRFVICYDVVDDKRRCRIGECLDGYGDRVQDSVFEAVLGPPLFDKMVLDLRTLIDAKQDRVAIYALCAACEGRRVDLGLAAAREPPGSETVFVV